MLASKLLSCRSLVALSRKFPPPLVRSCHEASKVEEQHKILVYEAPYGVRLRLTKYLSLSSSVAFLAICPSLTAKLIEKDVNIFGLTAGIGLLLVAVSTPAILHVVSSGYVLTLRFEPHTKIFEIETYTIFGNRRKTEFTQDEVDFPDILGPFSNMTIRDKSYLIDFDAIRDPDALSVLMKYDKPLDLMMGPNTKEDEK